MGSLGEQSQSQVLPPDARGPETTGEGSPQLGTDDRDPRPVPLARRGHRMRRLRAWALRLAGLFPHELRDQDLAAEMDSHLQLHIDDNLRSGMTPEQARRDAILKLGGLEPTKEACRERRTVPVLEHFLQDLRFALRQLAKNPGFTF